MTAGFSGWEVAAVLATYLFAAVAKGITGLGFSTTCLPFLVMVVGLKAALPLLIIPSLCSNIVVMRGAGRLRPTLRRFWPMLLATIPGVVAGLWVLARVDGAAAAAVLGCVLILWCLFALAKPDLVMPSGWAGALAPVSGALTGLLNGLTGSQVMPLMPYLMTLQLDRATFLQAMNASFTLSSLVMAAGLSRLGLFTPGALWVSVIGTAGVIVGVRAGARIRARLSPDAFRLGVLVMLMLMGLGLLARAV